MRIFGSLISHNMEFPQWTAASIRDYLQFLIRRPLVVPWQVDLLAWCLVPAGRSLHRSSLRFPPSHSLDMPSVFPQRLLLAPILSAMLPDPVLFRACTCLDILSCDIVLLSRQHLPTLNLHLKA
jgi:hypothetical protein